MLLIFRSLILAVLLVLVTIGGGLYCLLRPRHRNNVHFMASIFSKVAPILGIKLIIRDKKHDDTESQIFVGNHQNNFDLFTHTAVVPKGTVSLGKKSLAWIPFFGQIYWLSGNILINRSNRHSAVSTMSKVAEKIKQTGLSVWIFPEGTRSRGRGLLPLKSGAFHTAIQSGAPIVPVVASSQDHINLNHWNNGVVIIEMLEPIVTETLEKSDARSLADDVYQRMKNKLEELNQEAQLLMRPKAL
ncbi:1-acylglycerol-3-phosphate O-acyltransferase [Parashewanella tropica]|uniref:1-acylglycerol-3-phosphate O-acyltransferase n=1 Tax=Parashewanella tropica TaxID=2547970 RepID=UPI001059B340|nr:1-acylglycerol-3-phosphate O-acyltransferase [Parashewanella tropica]